MGKITVFKSIDSDSQSQSFEIDEVLDRIKRGNNRHLIEQIRSETNKQKRDTLKKRLFWICFSGEFTKRNNESMVAHSGYICLDFDGIPEREMQLWRTKIQGNKHTYSCFTSPSGNGLKVIWLIPECKTNEEHNLRFESIAKEFESCRYFDHNVKGWSRVCFESYDPHIYVNQYAETFTSIIRTKEPSTPREHIRHESTGEDTDIETLLQVIESQRIDITQNYKDWVDIGLVLADVYKEQGANYFERLSRFNSGFDLNKCSKQFDYCLRTSSGKATMAKIFFIAKNYGITIHSEELPNVSDRFPDDLTIELDEPETVHETIPHIFWTYSGRGAIKVDYLNLKKFLEQNGFFKYRFNPEDISFIRIVQNVIEVVTIDMIKDFVLNYLLEANETAAYNLFAGDSKFEKKYIAFLEVKKPAIIRDTKFTSWVFYRNTAVCVSKDGIELVPYIDLMGGYIWKSQIIGRDFSLNNPGEHSDTSARCDFAQFLLNVSAGNISRCQSLMSGIGYMMHRFKDPSTVRALIANEEVISSNPAGGTGKGLIFLAMSKIRVTVFINGKSFDPNKDFTWQRVNPDTEIVVLDDTARNFNFESIFSILTTGWPINKKNKGEIYLDPADSPKIGIPTNNVLKGSSSSHERRKFEVEFHPHYSDSFQPIDDFKKNFWTDWDADEWNKFDNLMLDCIKLYLTEGLIKVDFVNLKIKKLISETSEEFVEFAKMWLVNNSRHNRNDTFKQFINDNPGSYIKSSNQFYDWMREWGEYNGWKTVDCGQGRMYLEYGIVNLPMPEKEDKDILPF